MKKIINSLEDKEFIIDRLTDDITSTKFMGLCKKFKDIRRLDIRLVPMKSFFPAYLYFTGSYEFNERMRGIAKKQKYKLNEYGLYKLDGDTEKLINIYSEKDLFDILGMNYLEPKDRI
jgi:DNA polymerase (family 10)